MDVVLPATLAASRDGGQGDQVVAGVAGDVLDEDVVASLRRSSPSWLRIVSRTPSIILNPRRLEMDVPQRAMGAAFQGDGPAVRVLDRDVLDAEVLDGGQQDADVPPVAGLALPFTPASVP